MSVYDSHLYQEDLLQCMDRIPEAEKLSGTSILVTGAGGLIGSYITDILLAFNRNRDTDIRIIATGRNMDHLRERFPEIDEEELLLVEYDVNEPPAFDFQVDYIIHAASNAFPKAFTTDPVGTIASNIVGTQYLLDYAREHGARRLLFVSSGEVYGQGDLSLDSFTETYAGYVDPVQVRSCYPNSKRTAETLCVSYHQQYGLETVIVRPSHTYGPNATSRDNRANVQFINSAVAGNDIVMKSAGTQMRSYTYIADAATAILTVLICGETAQAYNIANSNAIATIAGYAQIAAEVAGVKILFEEPDEVAKAQQTPIAKQVLDSKKLEGLGWKGEFTVEEGIRRTVAIIREMNQGE